MPLSRAARLAALFLIVFGTNVARVSAHDIPRDVTVQAFARPEGQTFRLLVRVPMKAGDHLLYIAAIEHLWHGPEARPLIFFSGKYKQIHAHEPSVQWNAVDGW